MNESPEQQPERKGIIKSPKDMGMDIVANHVARYAKLSTDEMIEAIAGDALLGTSPQMLIATYSILHAKFNAAAERQTRRIIHLTWALAFLTFGLLVVAGIQTRYMQLDEQRKHAAESAERGKSLQDKVATDHPFNDKK